MNLLLIDDEPFIGELTIRYLRERFPDIHLNQVLSCQHGMEDLIQNDGAYDGVLLDEKLPGVRGLHCLRSIREMWPTLPVILLTGFYSEELRDQCMKAGADDFVSKDRVRDVLPDVVWSATTRRQFAISNSAEVERRRHEVVPDLKQIVRSVQDGTTELGAIKQQLVNLETSIRKFDRIITDGNGQPSVLQQLTTLRVTLERIEAAISNRNAEVECQFEEVAADIARLDRKIETQIEAGRSGTEADRRARLALQGSIACAIIAAIAMIITAIITVRVH